MTAPAVAHLPSHAQTPPLSAAPILRAATDPTDPDLIGNRNFWADYSWAEHGDEWSDKWGSTDALWHCTIYPRLRAFLPAKRILEIAPGFGRVTNYLRAWTDQLTVVDLVERCVNACRERFKSDSHIRYIVNDGRSLAMIDDHSIDLVVSWDSLVHVEHATVREYLRQLATKLAPGGIGFIHHSNLGVHADELKGNESGDIVGGRRRSMTAQRFAADCKEFGLRCLSQEIVPWNNNGLWMDAFSLFSSDPAGAAIPPVVVHRHDWPVELALARRTTELYRRPASRE